MTNISNTHPTMVSPLEDLNLIDAFLFQEATSNPIHAEIIDSIKHDERAGDRYMNYSTYVTYEELVERMKEDAYINAYDSGYNSGYSQAIQSFIHALKAISPEQEKVKEALTTHYHLSAADAEKYLAQYW